MQQDYHYNHELRILAGETDRFPPDVQAMLQAMYSRSYAPIQSRLPTTPEKEDSLRARLRQYYVGYGDKSVGQLGVTAVWFEGVSQLAAKAIEHHPLFNGQESSTRYIDFTNQPMINFGDKQLQYWQERWRALYVKALPATIEKIKQEYPFEEPSFTATELQAAALEIKRKEPGWPEQSRDISDEEAQVVLYGKAKTKWENTIKARAFDICGSLLPAGATTNVVMSATFDTFNDHFGQMLHHPSPEMRHIARETIKGIAHKYPDATGGVDKLFERNKYVTDDYFYAPGSQFLSAAHNEHSKNKVHLKQHELTWDARDLLLKPRARFQDLPRHVAAKNRYALQGFLDFRSFRDLHRHRNGVWLMPVLTTEYGFEPWYLDNLPSDIAEEVRQLAIDFHKVSPPADHSISVHWQYAIPMGYRVPMSYDCHLGSLLYLFERRTDKTVHQTARRYMQATYRQFNPFEDPFHIHVDMDEDNFTLKRGAQQFSGEFK
jgi:thymidylate synthase ThyX